MASSILVVFHTSELQTARIADQAAAVLRELGNDVQLQDVAGAPAPEHYDGVILGDSIHTVHHSKALTRYLHDHVAVLNKLPAAFFEVSRAPADRDDEDTATAHRLVQELLDRTAFDPALVGVFAGALVYTQYGWFKRRVVRAMSRRDDGYGDAARAQESADWQAVEQFARDFHRLVQSDAVATS